MNIEEIDDDDISPKHERAESALVRTGQHTLVRHEAQAMTPAQARVDSVARTMDAAMNKASTLQLTPEEIVALKADFPDEAFKPGAAGKESLIYIEHAFLRDRMNEVVGMGQWALLRTRPHWAEEFTTQKGERATRIYADCALLVRGCMVSEAIGEMVYFQNNASQNYGDAAEGAMTAAFRRCAKNFGIGLQAWKKDWCEGWWQRKNGTRRNAPPASYTPRTSVRTPEATQTIPQAPAAPQTAKEKADTFLALLNASRSKFLLQVASDKEFATEYFRGLDKFGLLPHETLEDLKAENLFPSANVGMTPTEQRAAIMADGKKHVAGINALKAQANQVPGAEMPPEQEPEPDWDQEPKPRHPAGAQLKAIKIKNCGEKSGVNNNKKWTRYWLVDTDDVFFGTFDRKLAEKAASLKGQDVEVCYTEGAKGLDLVDVLPIPV